MTSNPRPDFDIEKVFHEISSQQPLPPAYRELEGLQFAIFAAGAKTMCQYLMEELPKLSDEEAERQLELIKVNFDRVGVEGMVRAIAKIMKGMAAVSTQQQVSRN